MEGPVKNSTPSEAVVLQTSSADEKECLRQMRGAGSVSMSQRAAVAAIVTRLRRQRNFVPLRRAFTNTEIRWKAGDSCEQWVTVARHCVVRLWLPRTWRLWALKEAEKQLGKELTVKVNCARSGTSSPRTTEACRSQSAKTAVSSVVESCPVRGLSPTDATANSAASALVIGARACGGPCRTNRHVSCFAVGY